MIFNIFLLFFLIILEVAVGGELTITPSSRFPQNVYLYRTGESLNLTCIYLPGPNDQQDLHLDWIIPGKTNRKHLIEYTSVKNTIKMAIFNLQESDSGDYRCHGSTNTNPDLTLERSVRINVKKKKSCSEMFQCAPEYCIPKRYMCDGKEDCRHGEDEAVAICGYLPCANRLNCSDGRCIPHSWCCNQQNDPDCSTVGHTCCSQYEGSFIFGLQRMNDDVFFRTTVYTVIGCALTFMCFVTILVIAICRVHMKRTRNAAAHAHPPFSSLDCTRLYMEHNPFLITYNINNGVQCIVGRPVDPPPYCEVVTSPPKEGPPPAYASRENLSPAAAEAEPLLVSQAAQEDLPTTALDTSTVSENVPES